MLPFQTNIIDTELQEDNNLKIQLKTYYQTEFTPPSTLSEFCKKNQVRLELSLCTNEYDDDQHLKIELLVKQEKEKKLK